MDVVVLVPGIMGTELFVPSDRGEEKIWPPTPRETQFGYKRGDKLQQANVRPGRVIRRVSCFDFYAPLYALLSDLGYEQDGAQKRLMDFPYDWRLDLFDLADRLSAVLAEATQAGAKTISLVAHSMGGLISRIVLEDPRYATELWFDRVTQLITIATPHLGAPLALGRVLGRDSAMGISGQDFRELSNNEAYPSAYQLLPAPGELACWDQDDPALGAIDIYDPVQGARLGLNPRLVDCAKALHAVLAAGNAAPDKRYFYFAATGHRTVTRVNVFAQGSRPVDHSYTQLTRAIDAGDGTVPLYSALPYAGQRQIVTNQHANAFKGEAFRRVFVRLLGGDEGDALEAVGIPTIELSVEAPVIDEHQSIEVLLLMRDGGQDDHAFTAEIIGELVLTQVRQGDATINMECHRHRVTYAGLQVEHLRLYLPPIPPGHYQLAFEGIPPATSAVTFSVCATLPMAGQ